ncbi:MAG TPA: hypothetical protein VHX11_09910 [Acidobacteriaceae bacterium]|nr:hypothetical protein [Acidobacteriaceae bacterium]
MKFAALLFPVLLTGCLSHTRKLQQVTLAGPVMNADALQLVNGINQRYNQINSITVTVELTPSVGGVHKGKQTDYTSFTSYILIRKPQMLRVLVLMPVLHTHAVDLASDGKTFTLVIPPKNKAIEGSNSVEKRSTNPMENLRPNMFVDAILVPNITPDQIVSIINESTNAFDPKTKRVVETPEYDLTVLSPPPAKTPQAPQVAKPLRVIRISRLTLLPAEQDIYNSEGELETQITYGPYKDFSGTKFPSTIDINRPLDELRIHLAITKVDQVNQPLGDEQFQLTVPSNYQVQKLQ